MNTIYVHSLIGFTIAIFRGCRHAAGAAGAAGVVPVAPQTHQPTPNHLIVV